MGRVAFIVVAWVLLWPGSGASGDVRYDPGGPCFEDLTPGTIVQLQRAEKAGQWDQAVELAKQNVRGGCQIGYRWLVLANVLVEANRPSEAIQVIEEVVARGFDMNPSAIGPSLGPLKVFMDSPVFKSSDVGKMLEAPRKASDDRRVRFRAMLAKLPASQKPPENYVAKGACPFECCTYREWTVEKDTDPVVAPGSKQIVGRAKKGTRVRGMTGDVHLQPEPVGVLADVDGGPPKDSIAFVLDYEGEGFAHVWTRGKVVSVFLGVQNYCLQLSESCWGEKLFPAAQRKAPVWWVKIRLPNGVIGWSDKPDNFGNKDLCG